jgi:hypothetical protein
MISTYSSISQAVAVDGTLNFDTTRVLTGCTVKHADGTPTFTLTRPGYYFVTFDGVVTSDAAGTVTVELLNGADPVPGAIASTALAADGIATLNFSTIVRVLPSCPAIDNTTKLSVLNSGIGATFTSANINITKLC